MEDNKHHELFEAVRDDDCGRLANAVKTEYQRQQLRHAKQNGSTLLHCAVGNVDCVRLLLDFGTDIDEFDIHGMTPLHLAARGDYSESLLQLLLHKANINLKTKPPYGAPGETALEIAVEADSRSCLEILLFFGAEQTPKLDPDKQECQKTILHAYRDGKISCGGTTAVREVFTEPKDIRDDRKDVGISIASCSDNFEIVVRRIPVEFQSSSVHIEQVDCKDGEDLVTDIYQYRVNRDAKCNIKLPIVAKKGLELNKYREYIVRQTFRGQNFDDSDMTVQIEEQMILIKNIRLHSHGIHPMVGFGVFVRNKVQRIVLDPTQEQTITSEVDEKFKITVSPGGLGGAVAVEMEVMKTEKTTEIFESGESGDHTDFCTVRHQTEDTLVKQVHETSEETHTKSVYEIDDESGESIEMREQTKPKFMLSLRAPVGKPDEKPTVVMCKEGDSGTDPNSWNVQEGAIHDAKNAILKLVDAVKGCFIVVSVRNMGFWLKDHVRTLYEQAIGTKVDCVLFAAIKRIASEFLVVVILTEDGDKDAHVQKYVRNNYTVQEDMETKITMNKKVDYWLYLTCHGSKDSFEDSLPVKCQRSHTKDSTFNVKLDTEMSGKVLVFKKNMPKDPLKNKDKCKGTLPIYYEEGMSRIVPEQEFPSDALMRKLGERFGDQSFEIGIRLGITSEALGDREDPEKRNNWILKRWRNEYFKNQANSLDRLFAAFLKSGRPDLGRICEEEMHRRRDKDRNIDEWLKKCERLQEAPSEQALQRQYSYEALDVPDSPIDENTDPFLFSIVKHLQCDFFLFFEMGLKQNNIDDIRSKSGPIRWKIFQLLVEVRRKEPSSVKFLNKLLKALKRNQLELARDEVKDLVKNWLSYQGAAIDQKQRKQLEKLVR